jgi:hypothetical protein
MRQRLAPMLYDDTDREAAEALRKSVVAQAQCSPAAVKKQTTGLTEDGLPVHSFHSLLADLATLARNTIITAITPNHPHDLECLLDLGLPELFGRKRSSDKAAGNETPHGSGATVRAPSCALRGRKIW